MITKMKQILGAAAAMLMLAACGSPKTNLPLEGTQWKLTEMDGKADPAFAAREDTFNFTLDPSRMMVYGVGACNRLFGPYELEEGNGLDIERLASTMMACPNMDLESRFAKLLEEADKYEIDGDVLTLFDDGKKALVFKGTKAEPLPAAEPAAVGEAPATDSVKTVVPAEKLTPAEKKYGGRYLSKTAILSGSPFSCSCWMGYYPNSSLSTCASR